MPSLIDSMLGALGIDAIMAALLGLFVTSLTTAVPATAGPLMVAAAICLRYAGQLAVAWLLLLVAGRLTRAAVISPLRRWAMQWGLARVGLVGTPPRTAQQAVAGSLPARALRASARAWRGLDAAVDSPDLLARLALTALAAVALLPEHPLLSLFCCWVGLLAHVASSHARRGPGTLSGSVAGVAVIILSPLPLGTSALMRRLAPAEGMQSC